MAISFLQTKEWLDFQQSVGNKVWRYETSGLRVNVVQSSLPLGKNYLYVSYGPEIDFDGIANGLKNELAAFFKFVREIARAENSVFVKIEPMKDTVAELLYPYGLRKSSRNLQPQRTLVIDLDKDEYELLGAMHHKTRYNITVAEKHEVTIKPSHDVELFWKLMQKTTHRDKFHAHPRAYYEKLLKVFEGSGTIKTDLVMAFHNDQPIAGAIILTHRDTGYYLHGASNYELRNLMAPHLLHWDIIKYLKKNGVAHYDLWGVDAQQWPGVTRFKHGFGGRFVQYPGAFDLPISKFWYFLYNQARKIF